MSGCKYCHDNWGQRFPLIASEDALYSYGGIDIQKGRILANVRGYVAVFPINYCPVCGRQLESELRIESEHFKDL